MESDFNWLDLPVEIWELILCKLEFRCLLKASETCKKFNDVLSNSQRLMNKFCFIIGNPYIEYCYSSEMLRGHDLLHKEYLCELKLVKECLEKSERKYDCFKIFVQRKRADKKFTRNVMFEILKQFAGSVKQIKFSENSQDDNFFKIIQIMKNLKVLKFEDIDYDEDESKAVTEAVRPDTLPSINEIYIKYVNRFSFQKLYLFDKITTLKVNCYFNNIIHHDTFENFLLLQEHLKVLHLERLNPYSLFKTEKLTKNIKFTLDELVLYKVDWKNNENAMKFFKTQTNLKKISLDFENLEPMNFDELLNHLFGNNLQLKTVNLSAHVYKFMDLYFLEGIVNPSVENLKILLDSSQNATEFIAALNKLFPNVKNFTYIVSNKVDHGIDQIHNWKSLESLNCDTLDINQFFDNINLCEKLATFSIIFVCFEDCINNPKFMEFLNHHQNIKHMTINTGYFKTVSDECLSLIVKTLKSLETLMYNNEKGSLFNYLRA